jgi:protein SCO1
VISRRMPRFPRLSAGALLLAIVVTLAPRASAQTSSGAPAAGYERTPGVAASAVPPQLREVGFDQRLDEQMPLDIPFVDESGSPVTLAAYVRTRPVVLVFAYYECPMLCGQVISGVARALNVLPLEPGRDFEFVSISFDPRDSPATAAAKKSVFLEWYKRPGVSERAHFLTGTPSAIEQATRAAGFRYVWDGATQQFAHPTGVVVLTPEGRIARYIFGVEYGPRDLRLALVEASAGRIGSRVDALLLYCYHYDPMTGRYGLVIMRAIRLAGAATVLSLGAFIIVMLRAERRRGADGARLEAER